MTERTYTFQFTIIDKSTGETVVEDSCTLGSIDQFGGSEMVDLHVASTLRAFERKYRAEHEAQQ
jgi:hypothetical protein